MSRSEILRGLWLFAAASVLTLALGAFEPTAWDNTAKWAIEGWKPNLRLNLGFAAGLVFPACVFFQAIRKPPHTSRAGLAGLWLSGALVALLASFLLLLHAWDFFIPLVRAKTGITLQPGSWFGVDLSIYLAIVINSFQKTFPRGQAYACSLIVLGLSLSLGPILAFKVGPFQERFWWSFWVPMSFVLAVVAYRSVKKKGRDESNEDSPNGAAQGRNKSPRPPAPRDHEENP